MILGKMLISGERAPIIVAVEYRNATSTIARISYDLGVSHSATTISGKVDSNLALAVAIGHDIRNIAISFNGTFNDGTFVSRNEGVSFTETGTAYSFQLGIEVSKQGNHIYQSLATPNIVKRSINGGVSFTNITVNVPYGIACSENGQVVVISSPTANANISHSSDALNTINTSYWRPFPNNSPYGLDITDDGTNIFAGIHASTSAIINSSQGSLVTIATGLSSGSTMVFCSGSGQYVLAFHSGTEAKAWVSNNYGSTWTEVLSSISTKYIIFGTAVSNSGKYMVMGETTTNGRYYLSQDFGVSWSTINVSGSTSIIRAVAIQE